jgi:hypothetical protein
MNRLTDSIGRLKESLTDPDGFFNRYVLDPLAMAAFGYVAMGALGLNPKTSLDLSGALLVVTGFVDGLSNHIRVLGNRPVRDLIARPLATTLTIAYGYSINDPAYLSAVYGLSVAAIHAPEIVEGLYHFIQSFIKHYIK